MWCNIVFVTDELAHYATILFELFHSEVPVPPTGKRGRPSKPKLQVDPELQYATVKKTRKEGKIVKVERKIVFGTMQKIEEYFLKSPSSKINTSYIERTNLSMRLWDPYLNRKIVKFARNIKFFEAKLALNMFKYNFVRQYSTLTKQADSVPTTPAMAAKIADRPYIFDELLRFSHC
ncbi:MAG: hypothetical protein LBJ61_04285 [Deltaproteobacteria bacterium]|jgi:hypothetical protein|nr:hypothetical protein [Deltaproteobacteria bacterium]